VEYIVENICPLEDKNFSMEASPTISADFGSADAPKYVHIKLVHFLWGQGVLSDDSMVEDMIACEEPDARNCLFHLMETLPHD
jgi:hypothetical protein